MNRRQFLGTLAAVPLALKVPTPAPALMFRRDAFVIVSEGLCTGDLLTAAEWNRCIRENMIALGKPITLEGTYV